VYHGEVLTLFLACALAQPVPVEGVAALVNGVPILTSDLELAETASIVPRRAEETDAGYRATVTDALINLELRWQDLAAAAVAERTPFDMDRAWTAVVARAGGEGTLHRRLAAIGLDETPLRELVRRAAIVQAYVASRFQPFVRPAAGEVDDLWQRELAPALRAQGKPVPPLADVRAQVETLLRERKLDAELQRWTDELAAKAEVIRYPK